MRWRATAARTASWSCSCGELGRVHADHHEHVGVAALEPAQLLDHAQAVHAADVQKSSRTILPRRAPSVSPPPARRSSRPRRPARGAHPRPGHHDRRAARRWRRARAGRSSTRSSPPCVPSSRIAATPPFLRSTRAPVRSCDDLGEVGLVADDQDAVVRAGRLEQRERLRPVEAARERRVVERPRRRAPRQASAAVSRARTFGLVNARATSSPSAASAAPADAACSSPRGVSRRSGSGRAPCGSASPWRRSQSWRAMRASMPIHPPPRQGGRPAWTTGTRGSGRRRAPWRPAPSTQGGTGAPCGSRPSP